MGLLDLFGVTQFVANYVCWTVIIPEGFATLPLRALELTGTVTCGCCVGARYLLWLLGVARNCGPSPCWVCTFCVFWAQNLFAKSAMLSFHSFCRVPFQNLSLLLWYISVVHLQFSSIEMRVEHVHILSGDWLDLLLPELPTCFSPLMRPFLCRPTIPLESLERRHDITRSQVQTFVSCNLKFSLLAVLAVVAVAGNCHYETDEKAGESDENPQGAEGVVVCHEGLLKGQPFTGPRGSLQEIFNEIDLDCSSEINLQELKVRRACVHLICWYNLVRPLNNSPICCI